MIVAVNIIELASELADKKLQEIQQEELKAKDCVSMPNGIVKEEPNGDVIYTEEAQDLFNDYYDQYWNLINNVSQVL